MLTKSELIEALEAAGIVQGDTVHVQSNIRRIGPVDAENSREGILEFYLSAFQDVLGPTGTLSVFSYFPDYGRWGTSFDRQASPSRAGVFSEYVRTRPNTLRSLHPIASVAALGPNAGELCEGPHFNGFGRVSPWGRLVDADAKILALGLGLKDGGTSIFHHIEDAYGVPYKYTKVYTDPVYDNGNLITGPFTMGIRYHDFSIVNDTTPLKTTLVEENRAKLVALGHAKIFCAPARMLFDAGMAALTHNPYALLADAPTFRLGEIPMDGHTGPMRVLYDNDKNVNEDDLTGV